MRGNALRYAVLIAWTAKVAIYVDGARKSISSHPITVASTRAAMDTFTIRQEGNAPSKFFFSFSLS